MALKKDIILDNGVTTSHHRIVSARVDWQHKILSIMVGHYVNVNTRTSNMQPINITRYKVIEEDFPLTNGGITQNEMYEYLKTLPEYEGAEDEIVE